MTWPLTDYSAEPAARSRIMGSDRAQRPGDLVSPARGESSMWTPWRP
jgi:hypothetical protein